MEPLAGLAEADDAVYAVNGREEIIRVLKGFLPVDILDEAHQVEIELREHHPHWLNDPCDRFIPLHLLILDLQNLMLLDGLPQVP